MTDKPHPLTDEMMYKIDKEPNPEEWYFDEDDMRRAYDKGSNDQFEKVIAWLEANPIEDYVYAEYSGAMVNEKEFLKNLKEAMRPQEDNS